MCYVSSYFVSHLVTGTGDMVAIMISHRRGMEIVELIRQGISVSMTIEVGKQHGPWMSHYSVFFVSISFFMITAVTVSYFIFYSARRLNAVRLQNLQQVRLQSVKQWRQLFTLCKPELDKPVLHIPTMPDLDWNRLRTNFVCRCSLYLGAGTAVVLSLYSVISAGTRAVDNLRFWYSAPLSSCQSKLLLSHDCFHQSCSSLLKCL